MNPQKDDNNWDNAPNQTSWQTLDRFVEIGSPWMRLIGERLQDDRGKILDYWRVEKADSVVILTIGGDRLLFPVPTYRPGLGKITLDFPGGRVPAEQTPESVIPNILQRELGIAEGAIARTEPLNTTGWAINSSFSNQKLYGFIAQIHPETSIDPQLLGAAYPITPTGISNLLTDLTCLQCRTVLLEWERIRKVIS